MTDPPPAGGGPGGERGSAQPCRSPGVLFDGHTSVAVVSGAPDGIVAVDEEGVIRLCNPAAAELFGRPATELVGAPFGFPVVAEEAAEIDLVLPSGAARVVDMRVTATNAAGERLHIATLRDVTERRSAERELEAALERQDAVVAVAAHELRGPLAAISVLAHTLRDAGARLTEEQRTDIAERVIERTERLQTLVRRRLTAARIDARATHVAPQPVPVLEFVLERLAELGEHAAQVDVSCPPGAVAYVDRGDFREMLVNYLENAFTYGRPPVGIHVTEPAAHLEVRVRDHGPGVPPDFVPRLFRRFSRAPDAVRNAEGTGLGLWIVRALARAGGGDAWYEPVAAEGGAAFCLRLRRGPPVQEPPEEGRLTPRSDEGSGRC